VIGDFPSWLPYDSIISYTILNDIRHWSMAFNCMPFVNVIKKLFETSENCQLLPSTRILPEYSNESASYKITSFIFIAIVITPDI
jgi:hypothetical protein